MIKPTETDLVVAKPRLIHSENKLCNQFNCISDMSSYTANTRCLDNSNVCATVPNITGDLQPNNSCAKAHKPYAYASGETHSPGHPNERMFIRSFVKQGFCQDGASKSRTKIQQPISYATDCSSVGQAADCTTRSTHMEGSTSDSKTSMQIMQLLLAL